MIQRDPHPRQRLVMTAMLRERLNTVQTMRCALDARKASVARTSGAIRSENRQRYARVCSNTVAMKLLDRRTRRLREGYPAVSDSPSALITALPRKRRG